MERIINRGPHRKRINQINWNLDLAKVDCFIVIDKSSRVTDLGVAVDYALEWLKQCTRLLISLAFARSRCILIFVNLSVCHKFHRILQGAQKLTMATYIVDAWDYTIDERPYFISPQSTWFATQINDPVRCGGMVIPIGVPRLRHAYKYGEPDNYSYIKPPENGKILVGPYSLTHPIRNSLLQQRETDLVTVQLQKLSPSEYAELVSDHDFVCCPPGSVPDTYRLWETLYRGRIPILLRSNLSTKLQQHVTPIVLVDSFDEIWSWSEEFSISLAKRNSFHPSALDSLSPRYWQGLLKG